MGKYAIVREDEEKMEQEKEIEGLSFRDLYEGEGSLPNLYFFKSREQEREDIYRNRHEKESVNELSPNQYYAYRNIQYWLRANSSKIKDSFFDEFNNYMMHPGPNQDFLQKLAKYGNTKKDVSAHYVLWITEEDEKRCLSCKDKHGKIYDLFHEPEGHPNCRCKKYYFSGFRTPKKYLVVVFSGINTPKGSGYITALGEEIKKQLTNSAPGSTVDIMYIPTYDDIEDENWFNDGMIMDAMQVYSRVYDPGSQSPWIFANEITNAHGGDYNYVIFVGHSGGGVMASRVAETLDRIGKGPYVNKIIRIGSPELNMDYKRYQNRVYDLIMPGDPIPLLKFQRTEYDKPIKNLYLEDMTYDTLDSITIHSAYFQHNCTDACRERCAEDVANTNNQYYYPKNPRKQTNLEKTVNAFIDYID